MVKYGLVSIVNGTFESIADILTCCCFVEGILILLGILYIVKEINYFWTSIVFHIRIYLNLTLSDSIL